MNVLVFDIETRCPVLAKGEDRVPGITYADGWTDFRGMGIATLCAYDFHEARFRSFGMESRKEFYALANEREFVIGWNSQRFDDELLRVNWEMYEEKRSFDLMLYFADAGGGRVKLDDACKANGLEGKSGVGGALAPVEWQRGHYNRVIDYCLEDVRLTAKLFHKGINRGCLNYPYKGKAKGDLVHFDSIIERLFGK